MLGKMQIRGISPEVVQALSELAQLHHRSVEGEARAALDGWVAPVLLKGKQSTRLLEVSSRLRRALDEYNSEPGFSLSPSELAEQIGEDSASAVESWFAGEAEPGFTQLNRVARFLGIREEWLKHGKGSIFPVESIRLSENPYRAVEWLLFWDAEKTEYIDKLYLVRVKNREGNLYIVKRSKAGHYRIFITPTHVSDMIGAGGRGMLEALFVTLHLLYRVYCGARAPFLKEFDNGNSPMVSGVLLDSENSKTLVSGMTNPASILSFQQYNSMWWEDLWDPGQKDKLDYWPGCAELHGEILAGIQEKEHLRVIWDRLLKKDISEPVSDF